MNFKSNQQWKRTKKDLFETVKSEINYLAKNTDQKYLALCLEAEFFSISPKMEIKKWQLGNEELFALNDDDHTHTPSNTNDTESGTKSKEHTLSCYCLNDDLI